MGIDKNKALEWWEEQGINKYCDVFRIGHADFGDDEFVDIFWEHEKERGRDRIRKSGKRYNIEYLEV